MPYSRTNDFQWPTTAFGQIQSQIQLALALRDPLTGCGLEHLDLCVVMS
jgi:hypothetical protein